MTLTQEQANAIAEREFPKPKRGAYSDTAEGLECFWDDVELIDRDRRVYAKCLMDMNALIEAVSEYQRELKNPSVDVTMRTHRRNKMFTALSNLTKNIEP